MDLAIILSLALPAVGIIGLPALDVLRKPRVEHPERELWTRN